MTTSLLFAGLLLAQTASPTVAVALSSGRPGAEPYGNTVVTRVRNALSSERLGGLLSAAETRKRLLAAGVSDPRKCAGARKCLRELALSLGPGTVLVGVDVAKVGDDLVVHLEAVEAEPVADSSLLVKDITVRLTGYAEALAAPTVAFARGLREKLPQTPAVVSETTPEPRGDKPVADAPLEARQSPQLVPEGEPTRPDLVATGDEPGQSSWGRGTTVAGIATGAAALVAGALSVTFVVLGANDQAQWQQSRYQVGTQTGTTLSAAEADALVAQGNARFSVALATGIGAAALATAAIVLFTR